MKRRLAIFAFVLGLAATGVFLVRRAPPDDQPRQLVVVIESMKFSPATLNLRLGDTVVFRNRDFVPHTATSKPVGAFDSRDLPAGREWSFMPDRTGEISYSCAYHPMMSGTLVVGAR